MSPPESESESGAPQRPVVHWRIRCSLAAKQPHFRHSDDCATAVICNRCTVPLPISTDSDLRAAVHQSTWQLYHWKTFLCSACAAHAASVSNTSPAGSYCVSCYCTPQKPLVVVATKRGGEVPLCAACALLHTNQLGALATRDAMMRGARAAVERAQF